MNIKHFVTMCMVDMNYYECDLLGVQLQLQPGLRRIHSLLSVRRTETYTRIYTRIYGQSIHAYIVKVVAYGVGVSSRYKWCQSDQGDTYLLNEYTTWKIHIPKCDHANAVGHTGCYE